MSTGELLTRWTARLMVACYVLWLFCAPRYAASIRARLFGRWMWTAGCVALLIHMACVFAFVHHWSHKAAFNHTTQRTLQATGIEFGYGIYFNYAMAAIWSIDFVVAWMQPLQQPLGFWRMCVQYFVAFMMINATAVFGPAFWIWIVAGVICVLAVLERNLRIQQRAQQ